MILVDILQKIGFDWRLALVNLVNLGLIFWLLRRYLFGPVTKYIDARKNMIAEGVEKAKQAETELGMAQRKAQDIIDEAKVGANQILEQANGEAVAMAEKMKIKAKQEIEMLVKQAKKNIEIDKAEMKEEIKRETAALVVVAVEKIVGEKLDAKRDALLIQDSLSMLKK